MISKEEAFKVAKRVLSTVNAVTEEPKAYIFTDAKVSELVDDNEVVVLKKDGRVISYMQYIMEVK